MNAAPASLNHFAYRYFEGVLTETELTCDIELEDLLAISTQINLAEKNVASFVAGGLFLNMLLWGEKGGGKSTLIRILALKYSHKNLVTIEFADETAGAIFGLYKIIKLNPEKKFMLFFDDISFNESDTAYRRFKSAVEGGLEEKPKNVLFAATSNKRHMVKNKAADTGDIYDRDEANELTSLQARFGLSIGFYALGKEDYLNAVEKYFKKYKVAYKSRDWQRLAENYAIDRGGRNGRLAKQFAAYFYLTED